MRQRNWKLKELNRVKFAVLALLLLTGSLTLAACKSSTETGASDKSTQLESVQEGTQQQEEEPLSEAELKYRQEGIDTTEDDDPE